MVKEAPILTSAKVLAGLNTLGFGISLTTGSHVHLDLIGTGAFTVAAVATRGKSARSVLSSALVSGWATRLASFLFFRAIYTGRDRRLEDTLSTASGAFGFWFISFAWGWLTMLPHSLVAGYSKTPRLGLGAAGAGALYAIGLTTEVLADLQKYRFKQNPANRGKFCNVGVWAVSQHPNYFGNLLLWSAIWLINAQTLVEKQAWLRLMASTISPIFLAALFVGQSVGSVGPALELADQKYGPLPGYQAYKTNTPLIVPEPMALLRVIAKSLSPFGVIQHKTNSKDL